MQFTDNELIAEGLDMLLQALTAERDALTAALDDKKAPLLGSVAARAADAMITHVEALKQRHTRPVHEVPPQSKPVEVPIQAAAPSVMDRVSMSVEELTRRNGLGTKLRAS